MTGPRQPSPAEDRSELLKGTLDMLILKVTAGGALHGYAIAQRIERLSDRFFALQQGSLYPALHRLEDRGWLRSEWRTTETGREGKFYSLTRKGHKQLQAEMAGWDRLTHAVGSILQSAE